MDHKDIRVGNFIKVPVVTKSSCLPIIPTWRVKVQAIDIYGNVWHSGTHDKPFQQAHARNCIGIEINREELTNLNVDWCESNGDILIHHEQSIKDFRNQIVNLRWDKESGSMVEFFSISKSVSGSALMFFSECKYIHQLQNIFHGLFNKELEMELNENIFQKTLKPK